MDKTLPVYVIAVNLTALVLYGIDKARAVKGEWRIPESTLILCGVLGGCYGSYLGMRLFHHKTRKPLFRYGIPFLMTVWTAILVYTVYSGSW